MIWATSHLLDHMEVSHVDNHPDVTDHTSLKATIDLEMQREGPGIFRCKIGIQNNVLYQSIIKNCIKDEIFKALVPSTKIILSMHSLKPEPHLRRNSEP